MIVIPHDGFLVNSNSICFKRMYRCAHCDNVVRGLEQDNNATICEKCESELHTDDEIAYRMENDG